MAYKLIEGEDFHYTDTVDTFVRSLFKPDVYKGMTEDQKTAIVAAYGVTFEPVEGIDGLEAVGTYCSEEGRKLTKSRAARVKLAIECLNAGDSVEAVKEAAQVSYAVLQSWLNGKVIDPKTKVAVTKLLVTEEVAAEVAQKVEEARANASKSDEGEGGDDEDPVF